MTTSPETEPRFGQLRNDLNALYVLQGDTDKTVKKIAAVQEQHGRVLEEHGEKLDSHGEKLDTILGMLGGGSQPDT